MNLTWDLTLLRTAVPANKQRQMPPRQGGHRAGTGLGDTARDRSPPAATVEPFLPIPAPASRGQRSQLLFEKRCPSLPDAPGSCPMDPQARGERNQNSPSVTASGSEVY